MQNATYKKVAKEADDLYIATGQGVSRIHEVSGQITVASTSTTGNGSYDVRDLALDGPVLFTAESTNGETILYRGTAADAHNRLGRGTCDTNPLVSNEVSGCNGNASYSETDLTLPGKGLSFGFIRSFNAQDSRQGPMGPGWTHSLDMAVTPNPFNTMAMVRKGDGRRDKYQLVSGSYVGQVGVYDALVKNGNNTWTLTQTDQTKLNFDTSGRLTSIQDKNSNGITPSYNGSGQMTGITDSAGRSVTVAYNGSGKISSVTDNASRVWT